MENKTQKIAKNLSQFNNISLTKSQWEIILKGCGCPKSPHLWTALRDNNLSKQGRIYTLIDLNTETFNKVWEVYTLKNREFVKKSYTKAKARQKARAKADAIKGHVFYLVNGCLTTELPTED